MNEKEIEKAVNALTGEGFLKAGMLYQATEFYKTIGESRENINGGLLRKCGDVCIEIDRLDVAFAAYKMAGTAWATQECFIKLGDACIKKGTEGYLALAQKAYKMAFGRS